MAPASGPWDVQRGALSGDKWFHCHGVQGVFGPDGIFVDWYDVPLGKENDKYFMRDSLVNRILRNAQLVDLIQYWVYCKAGYANDTHVRSAYHGVHVTPLQLRQNSKMSRVRVGVEWGFGKVKARCPLIRCSDKLKLRGIDVARRVRVAVLLTNAHTCLNSSKTGLYFECEAPTLQEYFA
jgi:hypothetical protein